MSEVETQPAQNHTEAVPASSGAPAAPAVTTTISVDQGAVKATTEPAAAPTTVPEIVYELVAPEGSKIDQAAIENLTAFAKQQKLSTEQAKELLAREDQAAKAREEQVQAQLKTQVDAWATEIKNDKEIGGQAFEQNAQIAKRFVDRFGSPELKTALDQTGLGNHPALFKLCLAAGRAMQDDKMVFSGAPSSTEQESAAQILYGKTHKK